MPETDLLLSLAEIAGVFVGFAALISIRSGGANEAYEVTYIRAVVSFGLLVVIAALTPVTLIHYGITEHTARLLGSLVALGFFWAMVAADSRVAEARATEAATPRARRALTMLFLIPLNGALIVVVLGLLPDQEPALYLTAVVIALFSAGSFLLSLVYSQGRPATA